MKKIRLISVIAIILFAALILSACGASGEKRIAKAIEENIPQYLTTYIWDSNLSLDSHEISEMEVTDFQLNYSTIDGNYAKVNCSITCEDDRLTTYKDVDFSCVKTSAGWMIDDFEIAGESHIAKSAPDDPTFIGYAKNRMDFEEMAVIDSSDDLENQTCTRTVSINENQQYYCISGNIVVDARLMRSEKVKGPDGEWHEGYDWIFSVNTNGVKIIPKIEGKWRIEEMPYGDGLPSNVFDLNIESCDEYGITGTCAYSYLRVNGNVQTGEYSEPDVSDYFEVTHQGSTIDDYTISIKSNHLLIKITKDGLKAWDTRSDRVCSNIEYLG